MRLSRGVVLEKTEGRRVCPLTIDAFYMQQEKRKNTSAILRSRVSSENRDNRDNIDINNNQQHTCSN
jgi:hypothetical protein